MFIVHEKIQPFVATDPEVERLPQARLEINKPRPCQTLETGQLTGAAAASCTCQAAHASFTIRAALRTCAADTFNGGRKRMM